MTAFLLAQTLQFLKQVQSNPVEDDDEQDFHSDFDEDIAEDNEVINSSAIYNSLPNFICIHGNFDHVGSGPI